MDKYQKYILDKIEYANNFVFSHCQPVKNELDGSLEQYGFFEKETDTFQITQDEDIHKTKYVLTVDTKPNVFNLFEKILVHRKEKWEEIPFAKGQYRIVVDFSKRIDAIRFDFINQLADAYILKVTYIEADQEKYYAKLAQEKKEALLAAAEIKVATGSDLVNIYFQPCCDEYDHTEIKLFVPKDYVTVGSPYGPVQKPSSWSLIKKCSVPADDFFTSINGLAYGEYAIVMKQFDKDNKVLLETDYIPFSIIKPIQPQYQCVNVI